MSRPKQVTANRMRKAAFVEKARQAVLRKNKLFEQAWTLYKQEMDRLDPGWDVEALYVTKARATLQQEVNAKFHGDIVIVPNLS